MRLLVGLLIVYVALSEEYDYGNQGSWPDTCKDGSSQSPINII